jgi:hypothetical protein
MARLGGWTRIGIIISVVWILGAGIYTYNVSMDVQLRRARLTCYEWADAVRTKPTPGMSTADLHAHNLEDESRRDACRNMQFPYDLPTSRKMALGTSAIFTFVSLALGWGFVYLILFLVAWVKRGFVQPR